MNPGDIVGVKVAYLVHPSIAAEIRRTGCYDQDIIAKRVGKVAAVDAKRFEYVEFEEEIYGDGGYAVFKFDFAIESIQLDHVIREIVSQPLTIDEVTA